MYDFPTGTLGYEYFHQGSFETVQGSYADTDDDSPRGEYCWSHSLADVITPLLSQGLRLVEFRELDWSPFGCFEGMIEVEPGRWVYPKPPVRVPHIFALALEKPI